MRDWETEQEFYVFRRLQLGFDVSLAMQIVGFPFAEPDVDVFILADMCSGVRVIPGKVVTSNLDDPIILATIVEGYRVPIDGTHRMMKAHLEGRLTLPGYVLTEEETTRCAVHWKHRLPDKTRLQEIRDTLFQLGQPAIANPR